MRQVMTFEDPAATPQRRALAAKCHSLHASACLAALGSALALAGCHHASNAAPEPTRAADTQARATQPLEAAQTPAPQPLELTQTRTHAPNLTLVDTFTPAPPPRTAATRPAPAAVLVPNTDHVRVDVPAGLQAWLNEDDRMRPWLGKAMAVVDACYAERRAGHPTSGGTISFEVTMHKNARPSARLLSADPGVSGIVMCATARLLSIRMPLFTGDEGDRHIVRVRFAP